MTPDTTPWPYPFWIAHRGAGELAPENTLAAFRLGARHGYRMFECDAKLSADDTVFLLHDATLERTTSGEGIGGELPWPRLSLLDAAAWHSRAYAGEPPCSLASLAGFCLANGLALNIEVKPTPGTEARTGTLVAREAARLWAGQAVPPFLSSFSPVALDAARAEAPHLPRGLLLGSLREGWLEEAIGLECAAVVAKHTLWEAGPVAQVHDAGMRCLSYTVNDADSARRLQALGTDGIITDRVDLFVPAGGLSPAA